MKRSHKIKIDEPTFERLVGRHQTALIEKDPLFPFQRGDVLWLECPDGKAMMRTVGDVSHADGLRDGYVMLSLV
jgi:hypothetical protein